MLEPSFVKSALRLYLVTDRDLSRGRSLEEVIAKAVNGGTTMVQLREKRASSREFYESALRIKQILKGTGVPLIINDRADIAFAADADGVHLGQSDLPPEMARKILGKDKIIGLSIETQKEAELANALDVDYIAVSPVFGTPTKTDTAPALGLEGLRKIAGITKHPLTGIGGIHLSNAREIIKAGADGIAVVSEIMSAEDPELAAKMLLTGMGKS